MVTKIVVREYAELILADAVKNATLDKAEIPVSAFTWLEEKIKEKPWSDILRFKNSRTLSFRQFVGYIETPCGIGIEILPKNTALDNIRDKKQIDSIRQILQNMLVKSLKLTPKQTDVAYLETFTKPIHEWIFTQFLLELEILVLRGVRNDYERIDEENRYIKGQLDIPKQILNIATGKATHFHIKHDIYTPNRLENRLLATALREILRSSHDSDNLKLAHRLNCYFAEITSELQPKKVWEKWQKSRLLSHYEMIKPWCSLIIFGQNPEFMQGSHQGSSLLFDMNKLFESYVTQCLSDIFSVKSQLKSKKLLMDEDAQKKYFTLKPDLKLNESIIADCKWKLINQEQEASRNKSAFNLSQSDLYQIAIYGLYHLPNGEGNVILFYPENVGFNKPLYFYFGHNNKLKLLVLPFPLDWNEQSKSTLIEMIKMKKYSPKTKQELLDLIVDESINLGDIDTVHITDMIALFANSTRMNFVGIEDWDVSNVISMEAMFYQVDNFNQNIANWDVSNVRSMFEMFYLAENFNQDISSWNVTNVTDMGAMFMGAKHFNQDISSWNVANVTNMSAMFMGAKHFNQDISSWNVANVTNMSAMFMGAKDFNQNIANWAVSSVSKMHAMFSGAKHFNQNIGNWDVSNVTNMRFMFSDANNFNQNIASWDVSNIIEMAGMFSGAENFNQDISSWNTAKVNNMYSMFRDAKKFNQDLSSWDVSSVHNMDEMFTGADNFKQDIRCWDLSSIGKKNDTDHNVNDDDGINDCIPNSALI